VANVAAIIFGGGSIDSLSTTEREILLENAPTYSLNAEAALIDVLVASGLASSNREARTFIETGAIVIGEEKIMALDAVVTVGGGELLLLRRGKKNFVILHTN
jgi:tyrosyl-tRNA synthetase